MWLEETRPCTEPECGGAMEPEEEGGLRYFACTTCYREDYYERMPATAGCQLGIPADIRNRAQAPQVTPVYLGTTIGRRPR